MLSVDELKELGFDEKGIKEYYEYIKGMSDAEIIEYDVDIEMFDNPNMHKKFEKKFEKEVVDNLFGCLIALLIPVIFAIGFWILNYC